jgi:hypothetical protein
MDCSNKIYHQNQFGFARKCQCQQAVHLHFGNISLLLSHAHFADFKLYVTEVLMLQCNVIDPYERSIHLPTRDHCLMFSMSYNEIRDLSEILNHTMLMVEVEKILDNN